MLLLDHCDVDIHTLEYSRSAVWTRKDMLHYLNKDSLLQRYGGRVRILLTEALQHHDPHWRSVARIKLKMVCLT